MYALPQWGELRLQGREENLHDPRILCAGKPVAVSAEKCRVSIRQREKEL